MKEKDYGRYQIENMKNKLASNNGQPTKYTPLPARNDGPKIEVTINQNCEVPTNAANSKSVEQPFTNPLLPSAPFYKPLHSKKDRSLLAVAASELFFSVLLLSSGIWCHCNAPHYCPHRTGLWSPFIFLTNACIGMAAGKLSSVNLYISHLVLSLLSTAVSAIGSFLTYRNWIQIGMDTFSVESRNQDFCVLQRFDSSRLTYIMRNLYKYDFDKCLYIFKIGIAVNFSYMFTAGILAFLCILSGYLCCKRICTSCND